MAARTGAPRWRDYEQRLRAGLASLTVKVGDLADAGGSYDPNTRTAVWDPFHCAGLDCVIHELFHHCMYHRLASWGAGEEPITEALEDQVVRYINRSRTRQRWWRNALSAKLKESA